MTTAESEGFDALHDLFESWRQGQQAPELFAALAEASGLPQVCRCRCARACAYVSVCALLG